MPSASRAIIRLSTATSVLAVLALYTFLGVNGIDFVVPSPAQATSIILSLAAGEVSEESLTRWIRDNWPSE